MIMPDYPPGVKANTGVNNILTPTVGTTTITVHPTPPVPITAGIQEEIFKE